MQMQISLVIGTDQRHNTTQVQQNFCHYVCKVKQIELSTTEAEYMVMSSSLREALPLIELIKEIRTKEI